MGEAVMDPVLKGILLIAFWTFVAIMVGPAIGRFCGFNKLDDDNA